MRSGMLMYKNWLYIPQNEGLRKRVLELAQSSPLGRHSGYDKTIQRVRRDFFFFFFGLVSKGMLNSLFGVVTYAKGSRPLIPLPVGYSSPSIYPHNHGPISLWTLWRAFQTWMGFLACGLW